MAFVLTIETDNAAFESEGHESHIAKSEEIARILSQVAEQLADTPMRSTATIIHDINGNAVGSWHLD
jgi:ABC-type enterochelin transport system ATPase subunit|tara:strand:- start:4 stop:204 length:201 start_codon:yes stop_codon:yes gene_type:complete